MCHCCGSQPEETGNQVTDLEDFRARVKDVIEKIRPALQMDGGDITLIEVDETGEVKVALRGACAMCPHAQMTLKMGVEQMLKEEIPEVRTVTAVQDM